jgi:aminoglycoside phosphotransferase (APT) family kinase protein
MPERVAAILPPALAAQAQQFGDALTVERQQHVQDHINRMPRTLIHGDLHVDNLIVPSDEEPWAILDWQTCGWGPAVLDLAYVIAGTLHPDDVSREAVLLQQYYDRLPGPIRANYSGTQFLEDYHWALASIFRYAILVGATMDLRNTRLNALYSTILSGIIAANDRWNTFSTWI